MKKRAGMFLALALCASVRAEVNPNPSWTADDPVVIHKQCLPYDYYSAKDPTIVRYNGKWLVYYTGANQSGGWQMCFTSATTIEGLKTAKRTYMSKIGESYFCAPELFYFEPQKLWYLVYQDATCSYATSTDPTDPESWSGPKSLGATGMMGLDYFIICDDQYAYLYNVPSDESGHKLYMRKTTLANFPNKGWSTPSVAVTEIFEASCVYRCIADNQYYLIAEEFNGGPGGRYYKLFQSTSAGGPWTLVNKLWATVSNLKTFNGTKWTTNVSHGELIRAGYDQKLEIADINKVDFLIQGSTNTSGDYQKIPWDLGLIRNYSGTFKEPTTRVTMPKSAPAPVSALPRRPGNTKVYSLDGKTVAVVSSSRNANAWRALKPGNVYIATQESIGNVTLIVAPATINR